MTKPKQDISSEDIATSPAGWRAPDGIQDQDGPDLSKARLFADSNRGVYIPQYFAQEVIRELVTGVGDEDYKILEAGPNHKYYWDAWAGVLDNAKVNDPKLGECYLHHDGDLWVVPVEKEEPKVETKVILGHTFRPMEDRDFDGFGGADVGSWICYPPTTSDRTATVLILSPDGTIFEIVYDNADDLTCNQREWTPGEWI